MTPKHNPEMVRSFAYDIMNLFFLSTGGIFDSNTSPAEHEPLARARAFLADNLSRHEPLVMTNADVLNVVEFDVEPEPYKVSYTQVTPETIHKGVYNPAKGRDVNTSNNPFLWMLPSLLRPGVIYPLI